MTKILYVRLTDKEHEKLKTYASFKGSNLTETIKAFIESIEITIELRKLT